MLDRLFGNCMNPKKKKKYRRFSGNHIYENNNFIQTPTNDNDNINTNAKDNSEEEELDNTNNVSLNQNEVSVVDDIDTELENQKKYEIEFNLEKRIRNMCNRWEISRVNAYLLIQNVEKRQNLPLDKIPPIPIEVDVPINLTPIKNKKVIKP